MRCSSPRWIPANQFRADFCGVGLDFKGFYDYADGDGGIAIAESNSAELIFEATAPWTTYLNFTVRPLVPSEKSPAIVEKVIAWRDSIR
jgi:hypothetical protein